MIKYLIRPFDYLAGVRSLVTGVVVLLCTSVLAYLAGVHFDGAIDVHLGPPAPFYVFLAESFVDWLSLALAFYLGGLLLSHSSIRWVDIFGTIAMSRTPLILIPPLSALFDTDPIVKYFEDMNNLPSPDLLTWIPFILFTLLMLLCVIWFFALMYHAYTVSCNLKGKRAVFSFIAGILVAEIISSLVLINLINF